MVIISPYIYIWNLYDFEIIVYTTYWEKNYKEIVEYLLSSDKINKAIKDVIIFILYNGYLFILKKDSLELWHSDEIKAIFFE